MDFDDAKENIQPLATGRNASILQATLRGDSLHELQTQRHELEQAIHNYEGDDPLEAWYDYIIWIEQSFPSGGKESGLEEVLTKCLTYFEHETRYHQDRRLIQLYIKFIDMHKNPTECYQQLFSEGIGTMVADLYISWAYCHDLCGNYRKADEIFRRGIMCRAQPLEELQEAHQHFGFVVSQRFLYKDDENETELANRQLNERRLALTSLRSHRKKVGSIRTGSAVKSYVPGTVQIDAANTSTRRCNAQLAVFSDENLNPNFVLPTPITSCNNEGSENEKKSVIRSIIAATRDQENQKEPGPWNKAYDKKKGKLFTKSTTNLGFSILEDNTTPEITIPEKPAYTTEIVIEKPFKPFPNFTAKNRPQPDWPTPVTIENEAQPRIYPQYNKCKLYPRPNMEFQLEELLAYNWFRKRGITNKFTEERDNVWQNKQENINQMRQYPNFAKNSRTQIPSSLDNFYAPEKLDNMVVDYNEIYNTAEKQEMQFEEILYKRWHAGERKLRYDVNDTIIIATEMEETFCMAQDFEPTNRRKSFFPARKSMFQKTSPQLQQDQKFVKTDIDVVKLTINDVTKSALRTENIVPNFEAEQALQRPMENLKIYDDNAPSTSKVAAAIPRDDIFVSLEKPLQDSKTETAFLHTAPQNCFEFKIPALPTTNVKNKTPFEIYEEPAKDQLNVPTIPENVDFFDETCTTQVFNCFIKSQSASTPNAPQKVAPRIFGTVLKERSDPEAVLELIPPTSIELNAEVTGATTTGTTNSFSPLQPKQLSTILETSEHGTTKSISSPEYETDTKMSTARLLTTQHTTNLETVKELSCEISTRTEQLLLNTMPKNTDIVMVDSTQVEGLILPSSAVNTPAAPRIATLNFAIFEDPTETTTTVNIQPQHVGNFSRLEEREDATSGYLMPSIKFQEDKTETIPRIMYTSKQNVGKIQDEKTETLPKILVTFSGCGDKKSADTLSNLPIKLPEKMDDSFNFFTQTPPKFSKSINNQTSMISTTELLGFDSENSPIGGATAPKQKCNYNTPELRDKMSFMRHISEGTVNKDTSKIKILSDSSHVSATQPSQQNSSDLKKSFVSDFSFIAETQATNQKLMSNNEDSIIKNSQPIIASSSKLRQQSVKVNPIMKSILRESVELPDFSIVMDSQPTQNVQTKWKQNQIIPPPELKCKNTATVAQQNMQQEHILTDAFMKDFSAIKDPLPEPTVNRANHTTDIKILAEKSTCNLSILKWAEIATDKSRQQVFTSEGTKEPIQPHLVTSSTQGNIKTRQVSDNFLQPAFAYGAKKSNSSRLEATTKPDEFCEYNAETAQFATNLSMIKNSTLLKEINKRQTQFQDKSLHIKDEQQSQIGNSFDTSCQAFESPPLTLGIPSSQSRKSIAPKLSKLSFLNADVSTTVPTGVAPAPELSNSLRFSIDLSSDELAALQKANTSKHGSSVAIEFKAPSNFTEKPQLKTNQFDNCEEIDHTTDENEMIICVKHTPKAPSCQDHTVSKFSQLNLPSARTYTAVAPELSNSLRFSIDLSSDELVALQKANTSNHSSSVAIEFKTPTNFTEKPQLKTNRIENSEEIDLTADDADYKNEMSIYEKNTPKTPTYHHHIWNNELQNELEDDGSNHFVHPETDLNHTEQVIENISLDKNVNPFKIDLINALLEKVDFINYIEKLPECELVGKVKQLHKDSIVMVNDVRFKVLKLVGQGAYGAVFCASECKTGKKFALKQERPANYWEYYICLELRSRLTVDELVSAYMTIDYALVGNNASILVSQFSIYGNLITVCNKIKKATMKNVDEYVVMHLTCQLLEIIDHLHAAGIIHADIKADNFLLMEKLSYDSNHISLTLIDFGVSIDTRFFKKGQCFTFVHKDIAMNCIEMRENRPWTYQLDLYGLAGVIHVLLFGKYMDVEKNANGFWMHKTYVPRYLNKLLWEKIFKSLLNIRDCTSLSMPNLQNLRALIKEEIAENENEVIRKIFNFNRALES